MPSEGAETAEAAAPPAPGPPVPPADGLHAEAGPEEPGAGPPAATAGPAGVPLPPRLWAVVMVFDVSVELPAPHALVTLREVAEPHRLVALPVGVPEATALAHAWRGVATPRPLTHELFCEVLVRLGATIEVVRLLGRTAGVVSAEMELSTPRGREVVACRPSDALTLSIRQGVPAPILLDQRLFDPAGDVDPGA